MYKVEYKPSEVDPDPDGLTFGQRFARQLRKALQEGMIGGSNSLLQYFPQVFIK